MVQRASVAEARAELPSLVDRVAKGGDRVVLTSRGRPMAALVGLDDLAVIEDLSAPAESMGSGLVEADRLVERIRHRRMGALLSDSGEDLAALREGELQAVATPDQRLSRGEAPSTPRSPRVAGVFGPPIVGVEVRLQQQDRGDAAHHAGPIPDLLFPSSRTDP